MGDSFATQLKLVRAASGLTQQKMADQMLIPKRTIEEWESEKRTPPSYVQRLVINELKRILGKEETTPAKAILKT